MKNRKSVYALAVGVGILSSVLLARNYGIAETGPVVKTTMASGAGFSLSEAFEKTSGIVVARLSNVRVQYAPSIMQTGGQDIMTFADAKIEESIKPLKDAPEAITVRTLGGEIGEVKQEVVGGATLHEGDRVLLFLGEKYEGAYEIVGWKLGIYPVNEADEIRFDDNAQDGRSVIGLRAVKSLEALRNAYGLTAKGR
jgi:hypothetical protein